jgi:hypothetical protein
VSKRSESHRVAHTHANSDPFGDLWYRCMMWAMTTFWKLELI